MRVRTPRLLITMTGRRAGTPLNFVNDRNEGLHGRGVHEGEGEGAVDRGKFVNLPELLANFCLREVARRWGPAKLGSPANKLLSLEATSGPTSALEPFTDSLASCVPGPSTFSAEFLTEPETNIVRMIIRLFERGIITTRGIVRPNGS